jgi:hypothetical protein
MTCNTTRNGEKFHPPDKAPIPHAAEIMGSTLCLDLDLAR